MPAPVLQFKRGNAGVAGTVPALRPGEPAFSTNFFDLFVGFDTSVGGNKFFGSHRYWNREDGSNSLRLNLVAADGNVNNSIQLKSPNAHTGITTYTFPSTPDSGKFLSVDGSGNLSWQSVTASASFSNSTLSGITTISGSLNNTASTTNSGITTFTNTTDNTLGNSNTGAVQIDGGVGIDKNLTVGANLYVGGFSEFVGVVTFRGGTINIGDGNTDNINVGGEFISGLAPNVDNTYDIGISTQRWKDAFFSGIGSFATGAYIDAIRLGITATNEIDTTSGNLILDSAAGTVEIQDNLTVSGITTLTGLLDANGGASIDNIQIGVTGDNEIDTSTGSLTLDSASGQTIIDDNLSVTGIATITGAFVANGNVTLGDTSGDTITINGTTTFNQPLVGTIGTATRATTVDTTTAATGTYFPALLTSSTGTTSAVVNVDAGISYVSNTDTLTLTGDIAVNGGDVTTSATTATVFNANATTLSAFSAATTLGIGANSGALTVGNPTVVGTQATQNLYNTVATNLNFGGAATALVMGAATGIATISNATLTLPNATTVNVNGANPTLASSSTGALTLFNTNLTGVNAFGAATAVQIGAATGITTIRNSLRVTNSLYDSTNNQGSSGQFLVSTVTGIGWTTISGVAAGTISTATRATTVDTIGTSDGSTYFLTFADTSSGQQGETLRVSVGASYIPSSNKLSVTTLSGTNIQAADGTTALTLATTGAVTAANDLTVTGNLYVSGSTTQVNTTALTVEDRTIDLGIVNGAAPASATTWDLGILFNYNSSGAKKSAVVWEHADTRFKFASVLGADTDGTDANTPQLTVTTFAPIEIGSLWVTDCAGTSQVISCTGTERFLENITVDAGVF
jgi:hypothetical protein